MTQTSPDHVGLNRFVTVKLKISSHFHCEQFSTKTGFGLINQLFSLLTVWFIECQQIVPRARGDVLKCLVLRTQRYSLYYHR